MTLCEELYFEITLSGAKSEIKKMLSFLKSGELDDFFEFHSEYISYDDSFEGAASDGETSVVISNDDCGIEIEEFDTDEFLEIFCRAAKDLEVSGHIYDIDDDEYSFVSDKGDSFYLNSRNVSRFNEDDEFGDDED